MSAFFTGSDAGKAGLEVKDGSGSPDVKGVTKINVSSGTLTDNGGGEVTITTGGGGGGGGTVNSGTEGEIAYYAATGTAVSGNSGLTFTDAAGVQTFKVSGSEVRTQIEDTTAAVGSRAVITLDPSVPDGTGGVAMFWGTDTTNDEYMKLGAFAGGNNIETKSRDFRFFGATGNIMTMDESTLRVGIGGIFGLNNSADSLPLPTRTLDVGDEDASTNTSLSLLGLTRTTSGTPAAGIGVGMDFVVECESSNETGATIEAISTDVSNGSERFDLSFKVMDGSGGAAAEKVKITSEGNLSIPTVGAGITFSDGTSQTSAGMPKLADISNITSDTTVTSSDSGTVFVATVGTAVDVTVTVPGTVGTFAVGTQVVIIKNTSAGSGALKIATDGSGLLNGASAATTITIGSPYQAYTVVLVRTSSGYNEWIAIG